MTFRGLTIYGYYDGPILFTAQDDPIEGIPHTGNVYLFRCVDDPETDSAELRTFKADGYDITIKEDQVNWNEA